MRMEAVGLITREPHPTDRRLVRLCVTQRGRQIRRAIDREMRELDDRALASMKPAERAELVRYLTKIRGNLAARGR